ncbi:putative transcription factor SOX-14 [Danaus plexippus plexippus]|uniref:Transcription factor SOX-14 n=1 Tax=Danaus plexippus plexippus TaxID=278856 RepID=A0A212EK11_DANPL|nr:putative transcription factor SOX-14 [Danaus plexippus plexippus]
MVPQQISDVRSLTPTSSGVPVFGSQLVDKNSSTPYTDATQYLHHCCMAECASSKEIIREHFCWLKKLHDYIFLGVLSFFCNLKANNCKTPLTRDTGLSSFN